MFEAKKNVDKRADAHRYCTGHGSTGYAVGRGTKVAENQYVIKDDIAGMHNDQRVHVHARHI